MDSPSSPAATRVQLVEPGPEWRSEFQALAHDFAAHGEPRYLPALADFEGYLRDLADYAQGRNLPPGQVPQSTYWGVVDGHLVGRVHLRHRLTPDLELEGGHIGYDVRPAWRRQGVATRMLALALDRARAIGLSRVLVTCDADNTASRRVIEKNGGRPIEPYQPPDAAMPILRYWIDLYPIFSGENAT